jgi:defect in organelle trafficking protein DotD
MKTKSFLFAVLSLLLLGCFGCHSKPTSTNKISIISSDVGARNAEVKLALAADSVSKSLEQLAEIEKATHPQVKMQSPMDPQMIGMSQVASIEWSGPVEPLVKRAAKIAHYKVRTLGPNPAIPVLVSISAKDTPLADILRDANFQCGSKASIVVYPASKVIELRYAKA